MSDGLIEIHPFDVAAAAPEAYAALNRHMNRLRLERLPDDPPMPLAETIQNLTTLPDFVGVSAWAAWLSGQSEIVGLGVLIYYNLETNQHLAEIELTVVPEYRRRGLGRRLLSELARVAQAESRQFMIVRTTANVPSGAAFMQRLGAKKGLEAHTNQLRLNELDRKLIDDWLAGAQAQQADFELGFWDGAYPEEVIQQVADLYELVNQQPFGELAFEAMHMTPEQLRQMENNSFGHGNQRWTFYLIDRQTGRFAGYTETFWNPNRPALLYQGMTGVFPEYRQRGLGRWLKATMLAKVLAERPQVEFVRTGNADTNAAMLKINHELGFKPYIAEIQWQVELDQVLSYLH